MPSASPRIDVDVAVIGAGVAGLWLANLLQARGLAVAVCARTPIGGEQTLASQGIIHSGLKYGLGRRSASTDSGLAAMPERWRACLRGAGELDLRGVRVIAERLHLHAGPASAQPRAVAAARLFASRCRRADPAAVPPFDRGVLFEIDEFAVDVPCLVRRLAESLQGRFVAGMVAADALLPAAEGLRGIATARGTLRAAAYVLAVGAGTAGIAASAGFGDIPLRRLPLRQTCIALREPPAVFAHCLTRATGTEPDLTITSHGNALYVGGRIAGEGAERDAGAHADAVRRVLGRALPAIDLRGAEFDSFLVDRAEPAQPGARRADRPFVARRGNCLLCLPVKLSLVPLLGDLAMDMLRDLVPRPSPWPGDRTAAAEIASPPYRRTRC